MNNNFGFYARGGRFHAVNFPSAHHSSPPVNQLLGVNDRDVAVGFYTDPKGHTHGYAYNIMTRQFHRDHARRRQYHCRRDQQPRGHRRVPHRPPGPDQGLLLSPNGHLAVLHYPGASSTMAFGVNDAREVVGTYTKGTGDNATSFGFTWTHRAGFRSITAPGGRGRTTINGVNDAGDLVGFFTGPAGRTNGVLWADGHFMAPPAPPVFDADAEHVDVGQADDVGHAHHDRRTADYDGDAHDGADHGADHGADGAAGAEPDSAAGRSLVSSGTGTWLAGHGMACPASRNAGQGTPPGARPAGVAARALPPVPGRPGPVAGGGGSASAPPTAGAIGQAASAYACPADGTQGPHVPTAAGTCESGEASGANGAGAMPGWLRAPAVEAVDSSMTVRSLLLGQQQRYGHVVSRETASPPGARRWRG